MASFARMTMWTLTAASHRGLAVVIGDTATPYDAAQEMIAAVRSASARAGDDRPRYRLCVDSEIVAIIVTGDNDAGLPDHRGAASLATKIGCDL